MRPSRTIFGRGGRRPAPRGLGFTLLEILVVVVVVGILATLLIGLTSWVRDKSRHDATLQRMQAIMQAMQAYRDLTGGYPAEAPETGTDPDPNAPVNQTNRLQRNAALYAVLTGDMRLHSRMACLPSGATAAAMIGAQPVTVFVDVYGQVMDYRRNGARAGGPVLIAPGKNNNWTKPDEMVFSDKRQ